ncbi:MAG: MFS transporter, partial [Acidimicrobiales bacterium]
PLPLIAVLVLAGLAVAFVQTPAATGATRSAAGRLGAGLGLFNLIRFAGSALGAVWVAAALSGSGSFALLFGVCAGVGALGLLSTWAPVRSARPPAALVDRR